MPDLLRGFILEPTYRVEHGRACAWLFGRLEDGRPFVVRDRRPVPHFFIHAADAERARALDARVQPCEQVTLEGRPAARVEFDLPSEAPGLRRRLARAGVVCLEADVAFATRYLFERGIRGALTLRGPAHEDPRLGLVFDEPELGPADWTPRLRTLSLDIETDPRGERVLAIALVGCGAAEVLLLTPPGWSCPADARACADERALLTAFVERVRALDPDVLTGWNVVDFDLTVLATAAARAGVALELGRGPGALRLRTERGGRGARHADVTGRAVLDGLRLMRAAFLRRDDWSLDAVARDELGEGKTLAGHGRADEILRLFREERERLVEYNRTDARLVLQILERRRLVELAVERSRLTGLPLARVSSSIAAFDFLYLSGLGARGVVAPSVEEPAEGLEPTGGGHVLEPLPGLYQSVVVLDFKSLYPSLIRTFEIDPWNLLRPGTPAARAESDPIVAPNGAAFGRRRGLLPAILDAIVPQREAAKAAGDDVKSYAVKILMNSFYGVLGTPACRFYDPRLANAITGFGREVLLWCRARIEARGLRVLYGDTDSLFVESGARDAAAARDLGARLARELTDELGAHVAHTWRVTSRLELQFERLYLRLCLPALRHAAAGARKRYAGLADGPDGGRVVFTGMEAVRGDWTELAKDVQRELYARLFGDRPVADYLRGVVTELRAGRCDARLVYRKALRKPAEAYTATTPPHVAAARKLGRARGRIAYVMTMAGPEPAESRQASLDYEHYVDKQVRAVAEPVLALLGLDFAEVVGDRRQLSLF
jgi:DNA polymerase-2